MKVPATFITPAVITEPALLETPDYVFIIIIIILGYWLWIETK